MNLFSRLFKGRSVREERACTPAWMEPLEGRRMMSSTGLGPALHPAPVEALTVLAVLQASGAELRATGSDRGAAVVHASQPGEKGQPLAILVFNDHKLTLLVSDGIVP